MKKRRSLAERFYEKVSPSLDSGCMEWRGTFINSGYGAIRVGGRLEGKLLAHRAAWQLVHGEIPSGMHVMHKCDNKRCVNVGHLALGTHTDNMNDCSVKGRKHKTRLFPSVKEIIALRAGGSLTREIAAMYGVSRPMISMLLNGKVKSAPIT